MIELVDIYDAPYAEQFLYDLLKERKIIESISHRWHPTFSEHCYFVRKKPYEKWYLILTDVTTGIVPVGSIYITHGNELGIFLKKEFKRRGIGREAVKEIMKMHPKSEWFANVSPHNPDSVAFFESLGFRQLQVSLQWTSPSTP